MKSRTLTSANYQRDRIARMVGVSAETMRKVEKIKEATSDLYDKVWRGKMSLETAYAKAIKRERETLLNLETGQVRFCPIDAIRVSPENEELYRPVSAKDPEVIALAESIRVSGVKEPLVVSEDAFLLSGHRRYGAAKLAGLKEVPCHRDTGVNRKDDPEGFLVALREYNRQRVKDFGEMLRENVLTTDPEIAHEALLDQRRLKAKVRIAPMVLREHKGRAAISEGKRPMLDAINAVLDDLRDDWPLSERQIHYNLLNHPPLRHASKPGSTYRNDSKSSKDLSDLLTRARLLDLVPIDAIDDDTRPVVLWDVQRTAATFQKEQLDNLLTGYHRDYLQSQPNHIELVVEKNTVLNTLRGLVGQYGMPIISGRGFSSLPPRRDIAKRYRESGKEALVLILVSDLDPDGMQISHSFAQSMRDDFDIKRVHPVRAALTVEQVIRLNLHSSLEPKQGKNYRRFVEAYGRDQKAYELEAVRPDVLRNLIREAINGVLDHEMLQKELDQEMDDAAEIAALRKTMIDALRG